MDTGEARQALKTKELCGLFPLEVTYAIAHNTNPNVYGESALFEVTRNTTYDRSEFYGYDVTVKLSRFPTTELRLVIEDDDNPVYAVDEKIFILTEELFNELYSLTEGRDVMLDDSVDGYTVVLSRNTKSLTWGDYVFKVGESVGCDLAVRICMYLDKVSPTPAKKVDTPTVLTLDSLGSNPFKVEREGIYQKYFPTLDKLFGNIPAGEHIAIPILGTNLILKKVSDDEVLISRLFSDLDTVLVRVYMYLDQCKDIQPNSALEYSSKLESMYLTADASPMLFHYVNELLGDLQPNISEKYAFRSPNGTLWLNREITRPGEPPVVSIHYTSTWTPADLYAQLADTANQADTEDMAYEHFKIYKTINDNPYSAEDIAIMSELSRGYSQGRKFNGKNGAYFVINDLGDSIDVTRPRHWTPRTFMQKVKSAHKVCKQMETTLNASFTTATQKIIVSRMDRDSRQLYNEMSDAFNRKSNGNNAAILRCSNAFVQVEVIEGGKGLMLTCPSDWDTERQIDELSKAETKTPLARYTYTHIGGDVVANKVYDILYTLGGFELIDKFNQQMEV